MTTFDIFRRDGNDRAEALSLALQNSILCVVQVFVASKSVEIVPAFFEHCDQEDECQWRHVCEHETHFELGNELTGGGQQEEHVEEDLELVVEYLWNEC